MGARLVIDGPVVGKGVGVSPDHEAIASDMSLSYDRIVEDPILVRSDFDTAAYVDLLWDCSHGYGVEPITSVSVQPHTVLAANDCPIADLRCLSLNDDPVGGVAPAHSTLKPIRSRVTGPITVGAGSGPAHGPTSLDDIVAILTHPQLRPRTPRADLHRLRRPGRPV